MKQWLRWAVSSTMLLALCMSTSVHSQDARVEEARKLHAQALVLLNGGNYRDGVSIAERALEVREQLLSSEHPDRTASMRNLSQLYCRTGAYSKAETLCKRAGPSRHCPVAPVSREFAGVSGRLCQ